LYARVPGVALSVVLHATCLLGVVAITRSAVDRTPRPKTSLTFAPVSLAVPRDALTARREPPRLALRKIEPLPKPPHAPVPADEPIRKVEAPAPTPTPPAPLVQAEIQDPPPNTIPNVQKAEPVVRVGAFEAVAPSRSRPRETAAVVPAGFGDASARGTARALPTAVVASGGFDREVAPPPPVTPSVAPVAAFGDSAPIEILFKPKPRYTGEAETLGIQGTVVLEVEFTASNEVRVLRVIRKLGHGLDEEAVRAAEQIRFKPARRQGVAVDSRVTVQIEFRLT
jgi:TonB family protein